MSDLLAKTLIFGTLLAANGLPFAVMAAAWPVEAAARKGAAPETLDADRLQYGATDGPCALPPQEKPHGQVTGSGNPNKPAGALPDTLTDKLANCGAPRSPATGDSGIVE